MTSQRQFIMTKYGEVSLHAKLQLCNKRSLKAIAGMTNANLIYILQSPQVLLQLNRMKSWHNGGFPLSDCN